jgi:hypothetical protein
VTTIKRAKDDVVKYYAWYIRSEYPESKDGWILFLVFRSILNERKKRLGQEQLSVDGKTWKENSGFLITLRDNPHVEPFPEADLDKIIEEYVATRKVYDAHDHTKWS